MRRRARLSKLFSASLILATLCACGSADISDSEVTTAVREYLTSSSRYGILDNVAFPEWFEIVSIDVKDRLVRDKEMTVVCTVAVRVKKDYQADSGVSHAYDFIVGLREPGSAGAVKASNVKFTFDRYEKGWRLR